MISRKGVMVMKKIKGKIITAVAVCLGLACGTGIVAVANEVINTAYVEDGVVYTDTEKTETVNHFYNDENGNIYIDSEMNIAVPHKTDFEVNENGETYGNMLGVFYVEDEPDLMAAIGDNGIEGYVRRTELEGEPPASPEEAIKMQEEREKNGNPPKVVNVYEADGVTVIDTLTSVN